MSVPAEQMRTITLALYLGPSHLPDGLLAGSRRRIELGLAVHANTLTHARVTAMADSCPRLIAHIGRVSFDALATEYVATMRARSCPLICIAQGFADWLANRGAATSHVLNAQLDAAALDALHAADAPTLTLSDLPGNADVLVGVRVACHPATRVVATGEEDAMLFTRIGLTVSEQAISADAMRMLNTLAEGPTAIADLLGLSCPDPTATLIALLSTGALTFGYHQEEPAT